MTDGNEHKVCNGILWLELDFEMTSHFYSWMNRSRVEPLDPWNYCPGARRVSDCLCQSCSGAERDQNALEYKCSTALLAVFVAKHCPATEGTSAAEVQMASYMFTVWCSCDILYVDMLFYLCSMDRLHQLTFPWVVAAAAADHVHRDLRSNHPQLGSGVSCSIHAWSSFAY